MDIADRAAEIEDMFRAAALRKARTRPADALPAGMDSASECAQCGDEIPAARRAAVPGVMLCAFCQSRAEKSVTTKG
jgi:phage/conjugal plasmid C-4 type zinc finger TraR family protein